MATPKTDEQADQSAASSTSNNAGASGMASSGSTTPSRSAYTPYSDMLLTPTRIEASANHSSSSTSSPAHQQLIDHGTSPRSPRQEPPSAWHQSSGPMQMHQETYAPPTTEFPPMGGPKLRKSLGDGAGSSSYQSDRDLQQALAISAASAGRSHNSSGTSDGGFYFGNHEQRELSQTLDTTARWPESAGHVGEVLNNASTSKYEGTRENTLEKIRQNNRSQRPQVGKTTSPRNRSMNPINHIGKSSGGGGGGGDVPRQQHRDSADDPGLTAPKTTSPQKSYAAAARNDDTRDQSYRPQQPQQQPQQQPPPSPIYDNLPQSVTAININAGAGGGGAADAHNAANNGDQLPAPELFDAVPGTALEVGSMIEVTTDVMDVQYGVIKWIGMPIGGHSQLLVGVELDGELRDSPLEVTNGMWHGRRLFHCDSGRGLFVSADQVSADKRFGDPHEFGGGGGAMGGTEELGGDAGLREFGNVACPIVEGVHGPMSILTYPDLDAICGQFRGIQGHHNSCYLDATLFSMFAFSRVFDSVLYRPAEDGDINKYAEIQEVLRNEIVNPLRTSNFVRADRVMRLRKLLEEVCSVQGLTSEEKDPEEFLNILLAEALKADPFLKLNSGQEAFCYQLFVDKVEGLLFPNVQQLFEQSFLDSNLKLNSVPNCLIIQMPRFGKDFKMYARILPTLVLDVTDVISNSPRQCHICGIAANYECKQCFATQPGATLELVTYCHKCWHTVKQHHATAAGYEAHRPLELRIPDEYPRGELNRSPPRIFMDLFAVVCIETSHYVSFVKTGEGVEAPWCFFDSMADRQGAQNGHNIPQLTAVEDLPFWISERGAKELDEASPTDRQLPKLAKRLLCDAYLCMYQNRDVLMYK